MKLLIDTHLLIWAGWESRRLSAEAVALIGDPANVLLFSALSVAEVAIKHQKRPLDFPIAPETFRERLSRNGYRELPLTPRHACRLRDLPPVHEDPFDRLLVAQALCEGVTLVTADALLARYPGQIIVT